MILKVTYSRKNKMEAYEIMKHTHWSDLVYRKLRLKYLQLR